MKIQDTVAFFSPASNLLTILIQYCKTSLTVLFGHCKTQIDFLASTHLMKYYWLAIIFPRQKMTTRNKRKLAALNKEICEENPRSNKAQNTGAPRSQEDYITQVSEEIEGRVTKRLSKEFSRTENRILGALARLDDFLMNPLLPGHSGTTTEPTRNTSHNNQGTNEDGSRNDPHPEAGPFHGQTTRNVSLEADHDKVTGVHRERERERESAITTWWQEFRERERERVCAATTWWQELQKPIGIATTWWQELQNKLVIAATWQESTKKSLTAPLVHLQESIKKPLYQSTAVSQRKHPCDDWGRPNFVGPSAVGK